MVPFSFADTRIFRLESLFLMADLIKLMACSLDVTGVSLMEINVVFFRRFVHFLIRVTVKKERRSPKK